MNHTLVTPALDHLDAVAVAQDALKREYDKDPGYRDQHYIAGLHQAINYGFKRAEVLMAGASARALERIADVLEQNRKRAVALDVEALADLRDQFTAMHGGA